MRIRNVLRMSAVAFSALALMQVTAANAADIYHDTSLKDQPVIVAAPLWQGFYIGGHIGAAWLSNNNNDNRFFDNFMFPGTSTPAALVFTGRNNNNANAFGGAQIGYNFQGFGIFGSNFVAGVEADIGGFGANRNRTLIATNAPLSQVAIIRGNDNGGGFYGDVTGRLGYAWGSALLYAKGGFAWLGNTNGNFTETIVGTDGTNNFRGDNNNGTRTGWTVGGGIEYAMNTNWTVKLEYLHFDFGDIDRQCCFDDLNDFRFREKQTFDTVKLGVNYIFHPAPPPLPYTYK
jgi:opacity protein-like surface antigen